MQLIESKKQYSKLINGLRIKHQCSTSLLCEKIKITKKYVRRTVVTAITTATNANGEKTVHVWHSKDAHYGHYGNMERMDWKNFVKVLKFCEK